MNPKKNEHKWGIAQNKIDRIERLLKARIIETEHTITDDMKLVDGVVVTLQVKADKDVKGDPNGRMRVMFGNIGERQTIPIKETETNVDGIVSALALFVKQKKQSVNLDTKRAEERIAGIKLAKELADELGGRYEDARLYTKCKIGKNIDLDFKGESIAITIRGLDKSQTKAIVGEVTFFGLLEPEEDQ